MSKSHSARGTTSTVPPPASAIVSDSSRVTTNILFSSYRADSGLGRPVLEQGLGLGGEEEADRRQDANASSRRRRSPSLSSPHAVAIGTRMISRTNFAGDSAKPCGNGGRPHSPPTRPHHQSTRCPTRRQSVSSTRRRRHGFRILPPERRRSHLQP